MIEIIPAILPKHFQDITEGVAQIPQAKLVQIDIVDGVYAKHATWPYHEKASFDKLVKDERGLPRWEELTYEFDLMVENPKDMALQCLSAGGSHLVLHARSKGVVEAFSHLVELRDGEEGEHHLQSLGIALMADAQPDELEPFDDRFDFVQVMGIARIGRQGEEFDPHARFLLERLRRRYPRLPLQVDGGVRRENVQSLVSAGATSLIAGSAIFGEENPQEALSALYTEANAH